MAAFAVFAVTLKLAFWQFERADEKRQLEQAAESRMAATLTLNAAAAVEIFQSVAVVGEYLPAGEILLDNRVRQKQVGYHVITPFALVGGGALAIKRGWLPGTGRREILPEVPSPPKGLVTVRGVFYSDEAQAFLLSDDKPDGKVWQWLDMSDYAAQTALPLMSLVLVKEPSVEDAIPAVSLQTDFKSVRSVGYAWQWLTFAALAVVFYVLLGMRK